MIFPVARTKRLTTAIWGRVYLGSQFKGAALDGREGMVSEAWGAVCQIAAIVLKQRKMPVAVQLAFSFVFNLGTQPLGRGRPLSGADLPMIGVSPKRLQIQLRIKINPQSSGKTLALRNKQTPFKNSVSERMCTCFSSLDLWTPSLEGTHLVLHSLSCRICVPDLFL